MAPLEEDRYGIKEILQLKEYKIMVQGNKLMNSVMYLEREQEGGKFEIFNHILDPRVS